MIVAEKLTRRYGAFTAVEDVSFEIRSGEVVGLLGHNGAGKTTIMKMLTGYLEPSDGRVLVDGVDLETDRERIQAMIGYLPENCPVYPEMTVLDYLDYVAGLRGVPEDERDDAIGKAMADVELLDRATQPIGALSRGLRQRVGVAQAIINHPKIVILDEPTNGLDPSQIQHMRDVIRGLAERATVLISTHILQEVQAVCDRVIILDHGRLALDAPLADLQRGQALRVTTTLDPQAAAKLFAGIEGVSLSRSASERNAHSYDLAIEDAAVETAAPRVARALVEISADLIALRPAQRDLESVFAEISAGRAAKAAEIAGEAKIEEAAHA